MLKAILRQKEAGQTIFTLADISRLTGREPGKNLVAGISYYVKKGDLLRLAKGLYAISEKYSAYELGNKLRTPSYISMYTVLSINGVVFQPYTGIYLSANRSEVKVCGQNKYIYRKIKTEILLNPLGLIRQDRVMWALPERALLDTIYIFGEQHFDNLREINWDLASDLNDKVYRQKNISSFIDKYAHSS